MLRRRVEANGCCRDYGAQVVGNLELVRQADQIIAGRDEIIAHTERALPNAVRDLFRRRHQEQS